jgi:hypothetical protein
MVCSGDKKMLVSFDITEDRKLENEEKFVDIGGEFTTLGAMDIPSEARAYLRAKFIQDFKLPPMPNA